MSTISVEQQINTALAVEHENHTLEHALQARSQQVARLVTLDETQAGTQLLEFIELYVRAVPSLLNDLYQTAKSYGLGGTVQPLVDTATQFYRLPPHKLGARSGLTALMVKAYLAHRLLEEVNDACLYHVGKTMIPIDMTLTNTIVHTLIGEPFANDMDEMVNVAVEHLFSAEQDRGNQLMHQLTNSNLVHIWQRLPSLSSQAGLYASWPS